MKGLIALATVTTLALLVGTAQAGTIVSFNDDASVPHTLTFGAVPVEAGDMLDVGSGAVVLVENVVFDQPSLEDIDAAHLLGDGTWVISTTTAAFIDGTGYAPGDLILWDPIGLSASLYFDESNFADPAENIDAVWVNEANGHILLSTAAAANLGTNNLIIRPGDIADFDPIAGTASLFFNQDTFTAGTASQRNIDALHIDDGGDLLISVLGSNGLLGGHTTLSQDITRFDGATGSLFLGGTNLYDGQTANLNALTIGVPEPSLLALAGLALLALAARRSAHR